MRRGEYALWLAEQSAGGLLYASPISVAIALLIGLALWRVPGEYRCRLRNLFLICQALFLFPVASLAIGAAYRVPPERQPGVGVEAVAALQSVQVISLLASIALVVLAGKGLRARVVAFTLPANWYSFWATFVAGMSVTGDWL